MTKYSDFDIRMKRYESVSRKHLMTKVPVIIRIDGKAFHTFTRGFAKPFDELLNKSMRLTALDLCKNIQGSKFAYTQSDEISIVLTDTATIDTQAFFEYNIQKVCSITASMATLYFNKNFGDILQEKSDDSDCSPLLKDEVDYQIYINKLNTALFDSRCFNIPDSEVVNYFIWRQKDCSRNSVQMVGRSYFSHKELIKVSCDKIQSKLLLEKDINWNNYKTIYKRGTGIKKVSVVDSERKLWEVDEHIPIFTQDRNYIQEML